MKIKIELFGASREFSKNNLIEFEIKNNATIKDIALAMPLGCLELLHPQPGGQRFHLNWHPCESYWSFRLMGGILNI